MKSERSKLNEYLSQDIEYLRADPNQTTDRVLQPDDVLADSEKGREVDGSTIDMFISEEPLCLEVLDDRASPDRFQTGAVKNRHCGRWFVETRWLHS